MRRGPGGGLVVTEPTVDAIIDAAVLYLHRANTPLDEVFEARIVVEEVAAELAAARLTKHDAAGLRKLRAEEVNGTVRDHRALHARLAAITRNPALELFIDILNRVAFLYFRGGPSVSDATLTQSQQAHARVTDAVLSGDADRARRRMRRHLEAESAFLQNRRLSRQLLPRSVALGGGVSNKRAEDVARAILQDVVADDLPPGYLLRVPDGADRPLRGQPSRLSRGTAAARAPSDCDHAPGPRRRPVRLRAERAGGQRGGGGLSHPTRHLHGRPDRAPYPGGVRSGRPGHHGGSTRTARPTCAPRSTASVACPWRSSPTAGTTSTQSSPASPATGPSNWWRWSSSASCACTRSRRSPTCRGPGPPPRSPAPTAPSPLPSPRATPSWRAAGCAGISRSWACTCATNRPLRSWRTPCAGSTRPRACSAPRRKWPAHRSQAACPQTSRGRRSV